VKSNKSDANWLKHNRSLSSKRS